MCGEKGRLHGQDAQGGGSPPRMRGKAFRVGLAGRILGITPACAGKRGRKEVAPMSNMDHPRVCGEKGHGSELRGRQVGSPPHVRGKGVVSPQAEAVNGITPAYAGKSCRTCPAASGAGDHPRVCGEKARDAPQSGPRKGSPPHVRGKVTAAAPACFGCGITPACAGKSRCRCRN